MGGVVEAGERRARGMFYPYAVLASCWAVSALVYVNRMTLTAVFPAVKAEFALSNAQTGAVLSALMASYALAMYPAGYLASRFGPRWVVAACLLGVAAMGLGVTLADGYVTLLVGFVTFGLILGMYTPAGVSIVSGLFTKKRRGRALGIHETAPPIGNITGLLVAGALAGVAGWRFPYTVYVFPSLVVLLIFLAIYRGDSGGEGRRYRTGRGGDGREPLVASLRRGGLWLYLMPFCVNAISLYGMYTLLPLYLTETYGVTMFSAAATLALCRVGGVFGSLSTGTLSDHLRPRTLLVALLTANAVLLLVFLALQPGPALVAVLMALGFISTSFFPLTFKLIADRTPPPSRPPVTGFFMTTSLLTGGALAPMLLGGVADTWGFAAAYLVPTALSAFGALMLATARAKR